MTNWINTVSRDHVELAVRGGRFTQANHGKAAMLRKMARGDWIAFYSPRVVYPPDGGEPLQAFTAIGRIADDEPYLDPIAPPDVERWRRNVDFLTASKPPSARSSSSSTSSRTSSGGGASSSGSACSRSTTTTSR